MRRVPVRDLQRVWAVGMDLGVQVFQGASVACM